MDASQSYPSLFAQIVDKLRLKSDEELKALYLNFFGPDLKSEWKNITENSDFKDVTEEDIIKAIQQKRYGK